MMHKLSFRTLLLDMSKVPFDETQDSILGDGETRRLFQ